MTTRKSGGERSVVCDLTSSECSAEELLHIAHLYVDGTLPHNDAKCVRILQAALDAGSMEAAFILGKYYLTGGCKQSSKNRDLVKAERLLRMAAPSIKMAKILLDTVFGDCPEEEEKEDGDSYLHEDQCKCDSDDDSDGDNGDTNDDADDDVDSKKDDKKKDDGDSCSENKDGHINETQDSTEVPTADESTNPVGEKSVDVKQNNSALESTTDPTAEVVGTAEKETLSEKAVNEETDHTEPDAKRVLDERSLSAEPIDHGDESKNQPPALEEKNEKESSMERTPAHQGKHIEENPKFQCSIKLSDIPIAEVFLPEELCS